MLLWQIAVPRAHYLAPRHPQTPVAFVFLILLLFGHLCHSQGLVLGSIQKAVQIKPEVETLEGRSKSFHRGRTDFCEYLGGKD